MGPMEPMHWLILLIALVVIEVISMGLTTIWFAGGALAAFIASLLRAPMWLQIVLFLVVSLVLLIFTRPLAMKYLNRTRVKTNVDEMIGKKAIVTEQVDNLRGTGHATVGGQEWMARSSEDTVIFQKEEVVTVVRVEGVKLIIRKEGGE